ncbi:hypothetical protein C488_14547 [Natrinema pellirubrum DSM 15624]|uniref:Uncharacterized protein n=1 Tax=Natrinema pellirubrum (strain DSM 15624 / CIP 106293 / JCM 10476 / NCIMB 786 / 157) TaxID=797303 RepID=L0JK95_NATP1|nr:hypothetical protein [Natrinema pellirubrum]AGB31694.1 hypothetical protein Natpe_1817 [Natrinema pellirubrum DSM 15624]ELY72908.1 hypothetical protein C488_14547 [Natrinema pellirubrum DSM 15624]
MSETERPEDVEYTPLSEEEFKENLAQLFEAMNALAPTRNYVSQMVQLLPQERRQMRHAYPDLFEQMETQQFLNNGFGLQIDEEEVSTSYQGTADQIESIVGDVMEFFGDDNRRQALEEYLDEEIPNPRKEWLDHRIKMAVSEPNYGEEIRTVFDTMLKYGDQQNGYRLEIDRVEELSEIEHGRLLEIKRFLVSELEIFEDRNEQFQFADAVMNYPAVIDQNL